jgi:hypothetical protein
VVALKAGYRAGKSVQRKDNWQHASTHSFYQVTQVIMIHPQDLF